MESKGSIALAIQARNHALTGCFLFMSIAVTAQDKSLRVEFARTYSAVLASNRPGTEAVEASLAQFGAEARETPVPGVVELRFADVAVEAEAATSTTDDVHWKLAHRLSAESPAYAVVAPDFEVDLPQEEPLRQSQECPPCPPRSVRGYPDGDKSNPDALNEPEWHLDAQHGANVKAAWEQFFGGDSAAGAGIVIGHPDTGYTEHPELTDGSPAGGGLDPESGFDFLDEMIDRDPKDPLISGLLRFPSHGTRTGSVIVSATGSQMEEATTWVSGVAPAATLVPLRVTEGVVLAPRDLGRLRVDVKRLANAISAAVGDDRAQVKKRADVISISLGGLPSVRLKQAIREAEQSDVIVVAAAGNYSRRFVVFPSAYATVVSVSASNYDSRPWSKSAYGSQIDISAPGETVWTAVSHPHPQFCLHASDGTSFATAITAGIAALWLSNPERAEMLRGLRDEKRLAPTFRRALREGFREVENWPENRYGPGIIDAVKLLSLDEAAEPGLAIESELVSWCEGDYESAYDELRAILRDVDDPRTRIQTLLDGSDLCSCDTDRCNPSLANEIAFIYAVDEEVANAFEDLNSASSPTASNYRRIRDAILQRRISPQLRLALE